MIRLSLLAVGGLLTLAATANAGVMTEHFQLDPSPTVLVGESCGGGFWRGPGGHCNPFNSPFGSNRGTPYECPQRWHYVQGGPGRCFPNR